ncbi:unnamed protein product [Rangifer tarandus platyrhynchus]|uniref:Uncharacterized protein n=1 Tax=Rangifer tarandus platyrhynchus TaxID=3082113 RepID=A0AC59ZUM8_RANTA
MLISSVALSHLTGRASPSFLFEFWQPVVYGNDALGQDPRGLSGAREADVVPELDETAWGLLESSPAHTRPTRVSVGCALGRTDSMESRGGAWADSSQQTPIPSCRYLHVQTVVSAVGDAAAHLRPVKQRRGIHSRVERLGSLVTQRFLGAAHLARKHSSFSQQAPEDALTCLFLSCCRCSHWVSGREEGTAPALWTLPLVHPGGCPARPLSVPTSAVAAFDLSFRPSARVGVDHP